MLDRVEDKTYQGFLWDIIRQSEGPDWEDDGLREILADYLEDRGEEGQSRFIRAQCRVAAIDREIAKLPRPDRCDHENDHVVDSMDYLGCPECELKRECCRHYKTVSCLLTASAFWEWFAPPGTAWMGAWPGAPSVHLSYPDCVAQIGYETLGRPVWTLTIKRGLVEWIGLDWSGWEVWGAGLRRAFPLRNVCLTGRTPGQGFEMYFWARLSSLPLGPAGCEVDVSLLEIMRRSHLIRSETLRKREDGSEEVMRVYFGSVDDAFSALNTALLSLHSLDPLPTFPGAAKSR